MGLQENYEKLANAIIIRAVKDYRMARRYLKKHPHTKELDEIVAAQAEKRRKQEEKRKKREEKRKEQAEKQKAKKRGRKKKLPDRKPTREEKLLRSIIKAESTISEVETFLRSGWYKTLTNADGEMILERLRAE